MILVECEPDAVLVCALRCPKRYVKHARGKGNIANIMRKKKTL